MRAGSYAIIVSALCAGLVLAGCGASGTVTRTSTILAQPVALRITSPSPATPVSGSSVTVAGTVAPSDAKVDVAGSPAAVSADGQFSASASVESGTTTIDVIGRAPDRSPAEAALVISGSRQAGGSGASGASATAGGIPTGGTSCGGGLSVGPGTSCAFARNVQAAYMGKGPGTYVVYSPATRQRYAMTCTDSTAIVTCQGATSAFVYFLR